MTTLIDAGENAHALLSFADCCDLSLDTLEAIENGMNEPACAGLDESDQVAILLSRLFLNACNDFISARSMAGLNVRTYAPVSEPKWRIESGSKFGATAKLGVDGTEDVVVNEGTLDFILWSALKYVSVTQAGADVITTKRKAGRGTLSLMDSWSIPEDPSLRAFSFSIALTAFHFVFFHEIGHHAQGHCRALADGFSDFSLDADVPDVDLRRQSLELMADSFAMRELLGMGRSRREWWNDLELEPFGPFLRAQKAVYTQPLIATASISAAIGCLFYQTSNGGGVHPKRSTRFMNLLLVMKALEQEYLSAGSKGWIKEVAVVVASVGDSMRLSSQEGEDFLYLTDSVRTPELGGEVMNEITGLYREFDLNKSTLKVHAKAEFAFLSSLDSFGAD